MREKEITLKPVSWDFVYLDIDAAKPVEFIRGRIDQKYDYWGILWSQLFRFNFHAADEWFCSEIIAAALKIAEPQKVSPGGLRGKVEYCSAPP
ncbi:hypothetical protein [Cochlodiniinecator piscidefendens]|uniref:hypothetical protein n=1 Tax=Cochlodiniinecator piscidefendens TaxID=2715756 RepID=UPI00140B2041|nr:hypothetical protein [Cochlodiniinecator piscidefendens]